MRGIISEKLKVFLEQVNAAAAEARANNVQYSPELVRGNLNKLSAFLEVGPVLEFVEDRIFVTNSHEIAVRVYSASTTEKLPVVLHFHGGGHMCGSIDLYDPISRKVALQGHCIVICVDYRLAPEHPYPAGVDDCEYALLHYQEVLHGLNYSSQVYILGDSAGGAICSTLAMRSAHNRALKIDKQILIYPSVDYTMGLPSVDENGDSFLLEKARISWYFDNYFSNNESRISVSPLYNLHTNLPKTLVLTAGCDPLRDEGLAYVTALKELDVDVEHHQFDGMIHAYMLLESLVTEECQQSYQIIADYIRA